MWDYKTASPDRYMLLREFARENRKHMTEAENVMWEALRGRRVAERRFMRQHIIGDFIVDFVCEDDGLIIEVDGGYHAEKSQQEDDQLRTEKLEELGFRVIRFTNEEVLFGLDDVLSTIENELNYK